MSSIKSFVNSKFSVLVTSIKNIAYWHPYNKDSILSALFIKLYTESILISNKFKLRNLDLSNLIDNLW